jgi:hypothetical protein
MKGDDEIPLKEACARVKCSVLVDARKAGPVCMYISRKGERRAPRPTFEEPHTTYHLSPPIYTHPRPSHRLSSIRPTMSAAGNRSYTEDLAERWCERLSIFSGVMSVASVGLTILTVFDGDPRLMANHALAAAGCGSVAAATEYAARRIGRWQRRNDEGISLGNLSEAMERRNRQTPPGSTLRSTEQSEAGGTSGEPGSRSGDSTSNHSQPRTY